MRRESFVEEVRDMDDLVRFCYDNNYEDFVWDNEIMSDDERNERINNDLNESGESWWDVRDWLSSLTDHGEYDWWYINGWGEYTGVDEGEFNDFKQSLLERLDEDDFFDEEDDDDEDTYDALIPDELSQEEVLEPGDFAAALGGVEAVPQYDAVVAMNLARIRAASDERIRVEEELQRIYEESNRLTAGNLSAVFQ